MSLIIDLRPDLESRLAAQAAQLGVDLPRYIQTLLEAVVPPPAELHAPAERAAAWRAAAMGLPSTPPLSDAAISRESLYSERE